MNFANLKVWNKSKDLAVEIFKLFSDSKDYGFKDQITRSALSIPSNIAEGFERESNKELIRFLYIAKGSCGELRTQLIIAKEINFIEFKKADELISITMEISYMLSALIKTRKSFNKR